MKRLFLPAVCLLLASMLSAGTVRQWTHQSKRDLAGDRMSLYCAKGSRIASSIFTEKDGGKVLCVKLETVAPGSPAHSIQLNHICRNKLTDGKRYRFTFRFRGDRPGSVTAVAGLGPAPYTSYSTSKMLPVKPEYQTQSIEFCLKKYPAGDLVLRLFAANYPQGGSLYLGDVTLEELPDRLDYALAPEWSCQSADGKVTRFKMSASGWQAEKKLPEKTRFVFTNRFRSAKAGVMQSGFSADWWMAVKVNGKEVLSTMRHGNQNTLYSVSNHIAEFPVNAGENTVEVTVLAGSSGCRFIAGKVPWTDISQRGILYSPQEGKDFRPLAEGHFLVKKGTALDLSELNGPRVPAGTYGRAVINAKGELVFEKRPDQPIRFHGPNYSLGYWRLGANLWTHQEIEKFADAYAAQGYNMIRLHYLVRYLLGIKIHNRPHRTIAEAGLPQSAGEIEFDPGNYDRFEYLVKCLKDRGVYLNLDLCNRLASSMAYREGKEEFTKGDLFFNPKFRKNWEVTVRYLLTKVNPYTRTALKDDPALVLVNPFNEQDFIFADAKQQRLLTENFTKFLKRKYRNEKTLSGAWGKPVTFAEAGKFDEKLLRSGTPGGRILGDWLISTLKEMSAWYMKTLREIGYPGLMNHYDMIMRTLEIPVRAELPAIAQHTYHTHPNSVPTRNLVKKNPETVFMGGFANDVTVGQESSFNSSYLRAAAMARFLDRPYFITEYSHCSFNQFRHERGLYFGGYAALQGWNDLAPHAQTVIVAKHPFSGKALRDPMWTFEGGHDPISRASETVTSFLFTRRDVRESPHTAAVVLKNKNLFPKNYLAAVGDDYAKLALLLRTGILYPEGKQFGKVTPDLSFEAKEFTPLSVSAWYVSADNIDGKAFPGMLAELRKRKLLPPANRTDWAKRIFESDTGELFLDVKNDRFEVVTPRTEGTVLRPGKSGTLPHLQVTKSSVGASFSLSSLRKSETIENASRLLLVVATNAFNSNMVFENESLYCCVKPGNGAILLRTIQCDVAIKTARKTVPEIYALHLDGTRFTKIPATLKDGKVSFRLDTAKLPFGAVYFEIIYP